MKFTALFALALLSSSAMLNAAENPLKNSNVGDFVAYKQDATYGDTPVKGAMKQTLVKKTETEATIETVLKMGDAPEMKHEDTYQLDKDYDPAAGPSQPDDATTKQLETGTEQLTLNGKAYKTKWVVNEISMKINGKEFTSKSKAWICTDVPLGGLVKLEGEFLGNPKTTMELVAYGTGATGSAGTNATTNTNGVTGTNVATGTNGAAGK